jgi:hypothetical protein
MAMSPRYEGKPGTHDSSGWGEAPLALHDLNFVVSIFLGVQAIALAV